MTTILAFDTSGPSLSVALMMGDKLVYECTQQNGLTHSDSLMPLVDAALGAGKLTAAMVDYYAVVVGPGSFTGVRIGVTTAKALVHATGRPVIAVNALEAIAEAGALDGHVVCPLQDARAGQVYCAAFRQGERLLPDAAMKLQEFLESLAPYGPCRFAGDGAAAHREAIVERMGEQALFVPANDMALRASNAARIALRRLDTATGWQALLPYYLRAPQAERERMAREAAKHG